MLKELEPKRTKKNMSSRLSRIMDFFGKGKGIFGDGLKYQKKVRKEWK